MSVQSMTGSKNVLAVHPSPPLHWVGDGFPVCSVLSPQSMGDGLSPFILMDYAGPHRFEPASGARGVDTHPHRGFETVTVVYQGELEHRDSAGNSGTIGPGDVQWMTAASGILHEEKHSKLFTQRGGVLEMAQLWVNLPARSKSDRPRYQDLRANAIPTVTLPHNAGTVRVIAGAFDETPGAAATSTPVVLWDVRVNKGARIRLPIHAGFNAAVFVRSGEVAFSDGRVALARQLAVLSRDGAGIDVLASEPAELLVIGGEPLNEPVVAHGPFVMNSAAEIQEAIADFRAGRFGAL